MALFLSSVTSKVDKKGRVLVPANFRGTLKAEGYSSFVAFRSFTHTRIECWKPDRIELVGESLEKLNPFGVDYDTFSTILSDSHEIAIDSDGRITLPQGLLDYAGITEGMMFVGQGSSFLIWEPAAFEAFHTKQRERANANRENFRWSPETPQATP